MSDNKINNALQAHFATREDVPQTVKNALHIKLHKLEKAQKENLRWLWVLVPCVVLVVAALALFTIAVFGAVAVIVLALAYHILVAMVAAAILLASLAKSNRIEVFV